MSINKTDFEYYEEILRKEWLGVIWSDFVNKSEEILEKNSYTKKDIPFLEEKFNIKIYIYYEEEGIDILAKDWYLIWEIKPWVYRKNWFETKQHLYKKIDDSFRWKWFWTILMNLYKEIFWLPEKEYSSQIITIRFLTNFWYKLVWKIYNWEEIGISDEEIDSILNSWWVLNNYLDTAYVLVLEE